MFQERVEGETLHLLRDQWPKLNFIEFCMNGADDVVRYGKSSWCCPQTRFIAMGRPGFSDALSKDIANEGIDRDAGYFLEGPELEDISSSQVREALLAGDAKALEDLLHPRVTEWCIAHYRK